MVNRIDLTKREDGEEARIGHEKYVNMSADEIERIAWIG